MSKTRKVSPARNAIKAKYASLMPHSRRFPEEECRKRGQRSPGATGTDDVARAPRAPPSLPKVVRPLRAHCSLRAHRMSCSAMNLRLSCPRPLGSSAHTSSSTMSMFAWVGSLNSTMPRLHHQMSQIMPDFRERLAVNQPMVVQFRYVKSELPLHCNDDAGRNPWRWQIFLGDGRSKVPLPSIDFLSCGVGCEFHHHHDCNCAAGGRRKISCPLGGPPLAHIILSRS